ncbi:MAG: precorrin-4 C(11)-methyltransferase [Deltaproteobacteria bacterium]|nr:MAG: precorrin-4 C(11)-methyltransferase [Deltaproteobacteria bacterium]
MRGRVYFIGAGPGDPELLTLKAKKIIERADVIIYADSLIDPRVCSFAREDAEIYGSSRLSLKEIIELIRKAVDKGKLVARLQSGDPAVYGALWEQMRALEERGIDYEIIPGVSSLSAACAALKVELTIPRVSQTVILTRRKGRTPVPEKEDLKSLAAHRASMAIFLSVSRVEEIAGELMAGGYPPETPVAVVYRASWEDEKVILGTLEDIAPKVKECGIKKQALILVGEALSPRDFLPSRVYGEAER